MRRVFFFLYLIAAAPFNAIAGQKVAIIVDGNDSLGPLQSHFTEQSNESERLYKSKGYQVIRINASEGKTSKDILQALNELENIDQLSISFFSHGMVRNENKSFMGDVPFTSDELKRFPLSHLRDDELETQMTTGEPLQKSVRFGFAIMGNDAVNLNEDSVGLGELHQALSDLKNRNPNSHTTIFSLACFGSNATRSLQDIPGVQVFSGSSAAQTALVAPTGNSIQSENENEFQEGYVDTLGCQALECKSLADQSTFIGALRENLQDGSSYLEAFLKAKKQYLKDKVQLSDYFRFLSSPSDQSEANLQSEDSTPLVRPQSSLQLSFEDHCLGGPERMDIPKYCDMQGGADLSFREISTLTKTLLIAEVKKEIELDKEYLNLQYAAFNCSSEVPSNVNRVLQTALLELQSHIKSEIQRLDTKMIEDQIKKVSSEITKISQSKTAEDLISNMPKSEALSTEYSSLKNLANSPYGLEERESEFNFIKEDLIIRKLTYELNGLSRADFVESAKSEAEEALSQASESIQDCSNMESCNVEGFFQRISGVPLIFPISNYQKLSQKIKNQSIAFISRNCSASQLMSSNLAASSLREIQAKCITDKTKNDPLLRAYSLWLILKSSSNSKFCKLYKTEKEKYQKLDACLSSANDSYDYQFWSHLNDLFEQGLQGI